MILLFDPIGNVAKKVENMIFFVIVPNPGRGIYKAVLEIAMDSVAGRCQALGHEVLKKD